MPITVSNTRQGMHTYTTSLRRLVSAAPSIQWTRRRAAPTPISAKTGRMSLKSSPMVISASER